MEQLERVNEATTAHEQAEDPSSIWRGLIKSASAAPGAFISRRLDMNHS